MSDKILTARSVAEYLAASRHLGVGPRHATRNSVSTRRDSRHFKSGHYRGIEPRLPDAHELQRVAFCRIAPTPACVTIRSMTLVGLLVTLVIVGVLLWLVNTIIPMQAQIKTILNIVVVIAVCLWLLNDFGLLTGGPVLRVR